MDDKKKRGCNFSLTNDVDILMKIILSEIKIIENKVTDGSSQKEKQLSWKRITENFNSMSGAYRDTNSLKIKYDNIKRTLKKKISASKQNYIGTGGGPAIISNLLWYEDQLYANLKLGIIGLPSRGDSELVPTEITEDNDPNLSIEGENIYVIYEKDQETENDLDSEEQELIQTDDTNLIGPPSRIELVDKRVQNRQTPLSSNTCSEPTVGSNSDTNRISKNWNLKKRPRTVVTRQQKLASQEGFQKLAESKREMFIVQKECYVLELKEKTLEAQRKNEEWKLRKQILQNELDRKIEENLEFLEERKRKRKLYRGRDEIKIGTHEVRVEYEVTKNFILVLAFMKDSDIYEMIPNLLVTGLLYGLLYFFILIIFSFR